MTRKRCECNWTEVGLAIVLKFKNVLTKEYILKHSNDIVCPNIQEYIKDLEHKSRTNAVIENFLKNANLNNKWVDQVKEVYVCGKTTKNIPLISDLNKNIDRKKAKADIFVELINGQIIGFSVKMNVNCPLTNYSIEKLLSSGEDLKKIKKQLLSEHGFDSFQKSDRSKHNAIFYEDNIYWENLHSQIVVHKNEILENIKSCIFPSNLPYILYEFDGSHMKDLRSFDTDLIDITRIYPKNKDGTNKNAAKMWHQIVIGDFTFNSEIRWKGNIFYSPQIMITKN